MTEPTQHPNYGTEPTSGEMLAAVGKLLFGRRWQRPLAQALRRDERQIRRWVTGQHPLHPRYLVFHRLRRILRERAAACSAEAEHLHRWIDTGPPQAHAEAVSASEPVVRW